MNINNLTIFAALEADPMLMERENNPYREFPNDPVGAILTRWWYAYHAWTVGKATSPSALDLVYEAQRALNIGMLATDIEMLADQLSEMGSDGSLLWEQAVCAFHVITSCTFYRKDH